MDVDPGPTTRGIIRKTMTPYRHLRDHLKFEGRPRLDTDTTPKTAASPRSETGQP